MISQRTPSGYWLSALGLPYPVQSVADGAVVGGARQCIFSGNVVVGERITEVEKNRTLAFAIVRQPTDPEIANHATLHTGRFTLRDNQDGTTTLTGRSDYSLRIFPAVYFDLWARDAVHQVHARVFQHIKHLAEQEQKQD